MKHSFTILLLILLFSCSNRELGDPISPNHRSREEIINDVLDYYDYYKDVYLKESNGNTPGGGYYVAAGSTGAVPQDWQDAGVGAKSNSEATGYGMIISSLMGDKKIFDGLYNMFSVYKSDINPNLMSWVIPENEDQSLSRTSSASDGDMDIAYGLYLAHKKWGSDGEINYLEESKKVIKAMEESLIGDNNFLLFGDWSKDSETPEYRDATRSSDWFAGHFRLFKHLTGNDKWNDVSNTIYQKIVPKVAHKDTGLVPDFIKGDYTIPKKKFLESAYDGFYNWNTCRYPWRQSVAFGHIDDGKNRSIIKKEMMKIADFAINEAGDKFNFNNIKPGYDLEGYPIPDRNYTSGAFITPFVTSFTVDAKYQEYLNRGWDHIKRRYESYFSDSITILNMLYISGIWYNPLTQEPKEIERTEIDMSFLNEYKESVISRNGDFSSERGWNFYENSDSNEDSAERDLGIVNEELHADIRSLGEVSYSAGAYNGPLKLKYWNYYKVSLRIKSEVERDIWVFISENAPPWTLFGGDVLRLEADNKWHDYDFTFQMLEDDHNRSHLGIHMGLLPERFLNATGSFIVDDIEVVEYVKQVD